MYFNTKTIAAITLLSFAKKNIASSLHENANEAQAKKFEEECGCSIDALTGLTMSCTENFDFDVTTSFSNFATVGSSFDLDETYYYYDSVASDTEGVPVYRDDLESPVFTYRFKLTSSLPEEVDEDEYECSLAFTGLGEFEVQFGCWACALTFPPTFYPTSSPSDSPSDSPSFGNDDEDNDEDNNESDDEDNDESDDEDNDEEDEENDESDDEENDDGSSCCCEEKEVESSLLWTIKNVLVVGN